MKNKQSNNIVDPDKQIPKRLVWSLKVRLDPCSLMDHTVKNLPEIQETQVWSLGQEDPLEKGMATHSSILAWRIHGQRSLVGSRGVSRVRHDWVTNTHSSQIRHFWLFCLVLNWFSSEQGQLLEAWSYHNCMLLFQNV